MSTFDVQTPTDLEFPTMRQWLENYTIGPTARQRIEELAPSSNFAFIEKELLKVNELLSIRRNGESFPQLDFEELTTELKLLPIKNSVLSTEGF